MPTKHPIKQRAGLWRVWYTIEINGNKKRRSKSVKSKEEADRLMLRLAAVEQATRTGVATLADIEDWIAKTPTVPLQALQRPLDATAPIWPQLTFAPYSMHTLSDR